VWDGGTGSDLEVFMAVPGPAVTLTLTEVKGSWGDVTLLPRPTDANVSQFPLGMPVTLTATPIEGKGFKHWEIYVDPNFMGDANYAVIDANLTTVITMDADKGVTAVFKCGSGVGPILPMILGVLGLAVWVKRSA